MPRQLYRAEQPISIGEVNHPYRRLVTRVFGTVLAEALKSQKKRANWLERQTGLANSAIYKYLHGTRCPSLAVSMYLSEKLLGDPGELSRRVTIEVLRIQTRRVS